jgi:hypothetical protein
VVALSDGTALLAGGYDPRGRASDGAWLLDAR